MKENTNTNKLTPRQWQLYNYLKGKGDTYTSELDIALNLPYGFDKEHENFDLFHDSRARHQITKDIRTLNNSDIIHKLIISTPKGVKIATKQDADKWLDNAKARLFTKLKRLNKMTRKVMNDQQYRIKLSKYQQEIYETFLEEEKE